MANQASSSYVAPNLCIGSWTLQDTAGCGKTDGDLQENLAAEAIEIAGVPVNVFKLLGVHEQGLLVDLTGSGYPISSGSQASYDASNAYNISTIGWRSVQTGMSVLTAPSFLGYNFGFKKQSSGVTKYEPIGPIYHLISTIRIQQSANPLYRAQQIKIERSDDGQTWKRVDIVNLPDTANLETISFAASVQSPFWRIIPLMFAGAADPTAYWEVLKLQLMDYESTSLDNVQDIFLMENRDRDYATASICLKAHYAPFDAMGDLSKFGFNVLDQYSFEVSFARMVELLGRPIVIGDILELTSEMQYDHNLKPVKKYLEVTDTGWASDGFTTGWRPILYRFQANELIPSQENRDIVAPVDKQINVDDSDFFSSIKKIDEQPTRATEFIEAEAKDMVPETGVDSSQISSAESGHVLAGYDGRDYGVEDALPPNGLPYTEGYELPEKTSAKDGDFFRLNYPEDTRIPSRLFQFSSIKNKWIYLETDRRLEYSSFKPTMQNILKSAGRKNLNGRN